MSKTRPLSDIAQRVRRHDRDRFLAGLFAPEARREGLFALYAVNLEIARIREVVSEPMLGLIRLQWWRETIDAIYSGARAGHAAAPELAEAVTRFGLTQTRLQRLIEAREHDLDPCPPPDLPALLAYAEGTGGAVTELAVEALGAGADGAAMAAARQVGIGWALTGLLRAAPFHARAGRLYLPQSLLDEAGVAPGDVLAGRCPPGLSEVTRAIADGAREALAEARRHRRQVPRAALPALLPAVLADAYLARLARARYDPFAEGIALAGPSRQIRLFLSAARGRF